MAVITPANSNTKTSRPTSLQERESFKRVEIKIGPCVAFAGWSPSRTIISHVERVGFCIGGHLAIHVNVNTHVRIHTHIYLHLCPANFFLFLSIPFLLFWVRCTGWMTHTAQWKFCGRVEVLGDAVYNSRDSTDANKLMASSYKDVWRIVPLSLC